MNISMNLRQLTYACTVADLKSFSGAAAACHVTQPTLSNGIAQLEQELGEKLFVRTTRKVELTAFGRYLLPYLNNVIDARSELEKAAEAYHHPTHKLLRIGLSPLVDMQLLDRVLIPFRHDHPDVSVFFKECLLDDLDERLDREQIDLAVVPRRPARDEGERTLFFYEDPLCYLPRESGHSIAPAQVYRLDELPDAPVILTGGGCGLNGAVESIFHTENLKLRSYPGQALSYQVIQEWTSLGIGAGILPRAKISASNTTCVPLLLSDGRPATFSYEWLWRDRSSSRDPVAAFVDYLGTAMPQGSGSNPVDSEKRPATR